MNADARKSKTKNSLLFAKQPKVYDGIVVGDYVADLLVEEEVLVELKAIKALGDIEMAQCLNYLKATKLRLCLLLNFGKPRVEVKRVVNGF